MGGRDRSSRGGKKSRAAAAKIAAPANPSQGQDLDPGQANPNPDQNPNLSPNPNPSGNDESGWGYCTEEQLEELLLKNLDVAYKEALSRLVAMGYADDVALHAVLCSGHCCGSSDVVSNIVKNSVDYLKNPSLASQSPSSAGAGSGFTDLRRLEEYSLAGMVCLIQQHRRSLSRGDAMWCLLMGELHVGRACEIEIPVAPAPAPAPAAYAAPLPAAAGEAASDDSVPQPDFVPQPNQSEFSDATVGGGSRTDRSTFFSLSPSMKAAMRKGAMNSGFCRLSKPLTQAKAESIAVFTAELQPKEENSSAGADAGPLASNLQNLDLVDTVMKELENLTIQQNPPDGHADPKTDRIYDLIRQIRELESLVNDRRKWAQEKALQAARKLSNDLTELRMLRLEREQNQRLKKGKQAFDDATMKRLTEMENALKKASQQVDRANAVVQRLETENAEIRAEMEAAKLSASESAKSCQEAAKREKKCRKKLQAWEKQRQKMEDEIAEERKKVMLAEQDLKNIKISVVASEAKLKEEIKAKEQAMALAEKEHRAKEETKVSVQRRQETLKRKMEVDAQRYRDDMRRLQEELARLEASGGSFPLTAFAPNYLSGNPNITKEKKESNRKASGKLSHHKECIICMKEEVSVLLLPCAHQVLCIACNEDQEKRGNTCCPCCNTKVDERIRVYGVSSS
ncbi:MND1-interacting protein 1-like [Typha latifolia]|uniref:MND1-interacting protein 1-like n=1 Tax=Typha latifolia TaxID=4733 RepID=UPI003C2FF0D7